MAILGSHSARALSFLTAPGSFMSVFTSLAPNTYDEISVPALALHMWSPFGFILWNFRPFPTP